MALTLTYKEKPYKTGLAPFVDGVFRAPLPYLYRRPSHLSEKEFVQEHIEMIHRFFESSKAHETVAAAIIEPHYLLCDAVLLFWLARGVSELGADDPKNLPEKIKLIFNYFTSDLRGLMAAKEVAIPNLKIDPENFADLIELVYIGKINSRVAKDVLMEMFETGMDPAAIIEEGGLSQVSDEGKLNEIAQRIITANPAAIADYKKGKTNALQFLVGKAMVELKGSGNPALLRKIFENLVK